MNKKPTNEKQIALLKKELGKRVIAFDRYYNELDNGGSGDGCSSNLLCYISSDLGKLALNVMSVIEELEKLEMKVNGELPPGLIAARKEFESHLSLIRS